MVDMPITNERNRAYMSCKSLLGIADISTIEALANDQFIVTSVHDKASVELIVQRMKKDGIGMGGFNQFVCYVIGNAVDERYLNSVVKLKGIERQTMPMALAHSAESVTPYANLEAIPTFIQPYFKDPQLMNDTFGGLSFLRFPVLNYHAEYLPPQVVSGLESGYPMIQNWIPSDSLKPLVGAMENADMIVGITSLNKHGFREMINQVEAAKLAHESLGGFLYDEDFPSDLITHTNTAGQHLLPLGSFPVIEVGNHLDKGIALVRRGPIDERVFEALLKREHLDINLNSSKYPKFPFPDEVIAALEKEESPVQVRRLILEYLTLIRKVNKL